MSFLRLRGVPRALAATLLGVVGVFALDGLVFRTNLYLPYLEPASSSGMTQLIIGRERTAQSRNGDNMIVTMGDSRFAYLPKAANSIEPETGYIFRHAGVAGSDVRAWYYILRELDPTARRYRAVVFGLNVYGDEDELFQADNDIRSLHYSIAMLRWSDLFEFAGSFHDWQYRWEALRGGALKGIVFQSDVQSFLCDPLKRIDYANITRQEFDEVTYNFVGDDQNLAGLKVDWTTFTATLPPGADDNQRDTVNGFVRPPAPQTGRLSAYRKKWYGKIIDRYRGTGTKIIFVRLPRGPVPRPDNLYAAAGQSIRDFAKLTDVMMADESAFFSLEKPELFRDGAHLNAPGGSQFSLMLAREIRRMLGPPQPRRRP